MMTQLNRRDVSMAPLALSSFVLNRGLRSLLLLARAARKPPAKRAAAWVTGTQMIAGNPLGFFLPYMIGPRWNCHALTASVGPLDVKKSLAIDPAPLAKAASWTLTVHDERFRVVATVSASRLDALRTIDVPPGSYTLFLRYYAADGALMTPVVFVDGELRLAGGALDGERSRNGELLAAIKDKDSLAYRLLQYHAFYAVKRQGRLPRAWVQSAFLPAGNPDTQFVFGSLRRGQRLKVGARPALREAALVFACIYNESSFPMAWTEITEEMTDLGPVARDGAYLVRIVSRRGGAPLDVGSNLAILVEEGGLK
jgi:hypothetical protein